MEKMIAIVSFHQADNYGAVLQNFALQKAVSKMNMECVTVDYDDWNIKRQYEVNIIPKSIVELKRFLGELVNYRNAIMHKKAFENFRKKEIRLTESVNLAELDRLDGKYSLFLCGSDQIWNGKLIKDDGIKPYTLDFVNISKKASYAASAGNVNVLNEKIIENINKLDYISVREKELKVFLENIVDKNISVVCDPVMLLTKQEWNSYLNSVSKKQGAFLFSYFVGEKKEETIEIAKHIADEKRLKMFFANKRTKENLFYGKSIFADGPLEFILDIATAQYVVASSFHAVVFSIIFEKEFVTILHGKTGSRVRDLLDELGLIDRIVEDKEDYINKSKNWNRIDYEKVKAKLEKLQKESYIELEKICDMARGK